MSKCSIGRKISLIALVVCCGVLAFSGYKIYEYNKTSTEEKSELDDLRSLIQVQYNNDDAYYGEGGDSGNNLDNTTGGNSTSGGNNSGGTISNNSHITKVPYFRYKPLVDINSDFCGWIKIEGTNIDYPVMHTPDDPQKYLHLSFYGKYAWCGLPFVDGKCDIAPNSDNVIIYAHHMKDGSMFQNLVNYTDKAYYTQHSTVLFDTLWNYGKYEIIAVVKTTVSSKDSWRFDKYVNFETEEEFLEFYNYAKEHSLYDTGVTAEYDDKFLTLSTCEYSQNNGRLVVIAKKVN